MTFATNQVFRFSPAVEAAYVVLKWTCDEDFCYEWLVDSIKCYSEDMVQPDRFEDTPTNLVQPNTSFTLYNNFLELEPEYYEDADGYIYDVTYSKEYIVAYSEGSTEGRVDISSIMVFPIMHNVIDYTTDKFSIERKEPLF